MRIEEENYEYNVAWIDSQNVKGRGISQHANHLNKQNISTEIKRNTLTFQSSYQMNYPEIFSFNIVNKFTVKLMNKIYYHSNFSKIRVDFKMEAKNN